jgi:transposase-like protein
MAETIPAKVTGARDEYWRKKIAAQERSGRSVQQFCKEQGLNNPSFYYWWKALEHRSTKQRSIA